jgi:hypothetical protein
MKSIIHLGMGVAFAVVGLKRVNIEGFNPSFLPLKSE